jgi:hypothetical protein
MREKKKTRTSISGRKKKERKEKNEKINVANEIRIKETNFAINTSYQLILNPSPLMPRLVTKVARGLANTPRTCVLGLSGFQ